MRLMAESGLLPAGSLQLVIGGTGDLLDRLDGQDVVTFTGSADTAAKLRANPNLIARSIPFNAEADSLNAAILGPDVDAGRRGVRAVRQGGRARDDGQGGPEVHGDPARDRAARVISTPSRPGSPSAWRKDQRRRSGGRGREDGRARLAGAASRRRRAGRGARRAATRSSSAPGRRLQAGRRGRRQRRVLLADAHRLPRRLAQRRRPRRRGLRPGEHADAVRRLRQALALAARGRGSLVATLVTHDPKVAAHAVPQLAAWHGRLLVLDREAAPESTGHGSPLPMLKHGGPGRAGGGEELGGIRAVQPLPATRRRAGLADDARRGDRRIRARRGGAREPDCIRFASTSRSSRSAIRC